jgi:hypothetical protein
MSPHHGNAKGSNHQTQHEVYRPANPFTYIDYGNP